MHSIPHAVCGGISYEFVKHMCAMRSFVVPLAAHSQQTRERVRCKWREPFRFSTHISAMVGHSMQTIILIITGMGMRIIALKMCSKSKNKENSVFCYAAYVFCDWTKKNEQPPVGSEISVCVCCWSWFFRYSLATRMDVIWCEFLCGMKCETAMLSYRVRKPPPVRFGADVTFSAARCSTAQRQQSWCMHWPTEATDNNRQYRI